MRRGVSAAVIGLARRFDGRVVVYMRRMDADCGCARLGCGGGEAALAWQGGLATRTRSPRTADGKCPVNV